MSVAGYKTYIIVLLNHHGPWFVLVDLVLSYPLRTPGNRRVAHFSTAAVAFRPMPGEEANELRELLRF